MKAEKEVCMASRRNTKSPEPTGHHCHLRQTLDIPALLHGWTRDFGTSYRLAGFPVNYHPDGTWRLNVGGASSSE